MMTYDAKPISELQKDERRNVLKEIDDAVYALEENGDPVNYDTVHEEIVHLFPVMEFSI